MERLSLIEEFSWLSTLNHPNVVKLYDTFSEGDLRYFSMEVVEGKPIRKWFSEEKSPERWDKLRHVLSQAALAVAFLHDHEVLHRDIKSSNLMITVVVARSCWILDWPAEFTMTALRPSHWMVNSWLALALFVARSVAWSGAYLCQRLVQFRCDDVRNADR